MRQTADRDKERHRHTESLRDFTPLRITLVISAYLENTHRHQTGREHKESTEPPSEQRTLNKPLIQKVCVGSVTGQALNFTVRP